MEPVFTPNESNQIHHAEKPDSLTSFEIIEIPLSKIIRQSSPPPVLVDLQDLISGTLTQVGETDYPMETSLTNGFT